MNIEIIPNWHPVFVHFSVALFSIAALLYLSGFVFKNKKTKETLLTVGRWNLWLGALFTIGTVAAGFYAYNTVAHDAPSHAAMTDHRNWAVVTAIVFWLLALWAALEHRGAKTVGLPFVVLILIASTLVGVTGYKGGEVVYRYGLGVMSLPQSAGGHDDHSHDSSADDMHNSMMPDNHGSKAPAGHSDGHAH